MSESLHQEIHLDPSVAIAILKERTEVLGREMRELKENQRRELEALRESQDKLSGKVDRVLTVMSEARGGWRTVVYVGGVASAVASAVAWIIGHFIKRGGV